MIMTDFKVELDATALFEYPTIRDLSWFLSTGGNEVTSQKSDTLDEKIQLKKSVNYREAFPDKQ